MNSDAGQREVGKGWRVLNAECNSGWLRPEIH